MSKQIRKVDQAYEVCDFCKEEIRPIYDERLISLWPLFNPKTRFDGVLSRAKWLLANWSMESHKPSYMLHARCAHQIISTVLGFGDRLDKLHVEPDTQTVRVPLEMYEELRWLTTNPLDNNYGRF